MDTLVVTQTGDRFVASITLNGNIYVSDINHDVHREILYKIKNKMFSEYKLNVTKNYAAICVKAGDFTKDKHQIFLYAKQDYTPIIKTLKMERIDDKLYIRFVRDKITYHTTISNDVKLVEKLLNKIKKGKFHNYVIHEQLEDHNETMYWTIHGQSIIIEYNSKNGESKMLHIDFVEETICKCIIL
jgi:hypothetical protein